MYFNGCVSFQTYRWGSRATTAADDQPASCHSCWRSVRLLVFLQTAGLSYSSQVHNVYWLLLLDVFVLFCQHKQARDHKLFLAAGGLEFWFARCLPKSAVGVFLALIVFFSYVDWALSSVCLCSTPEQEQLMVMWLSWMIKEEEYFER